MQDEDPERDKNANPSAVPGFLTVFPKVALPMILALSDQSIIATALPEIAVALGAVEQISLVMIGYLIAATIASPVYGRLGDMIGRRTLLEAAIVIFAVASLVSALAVNLPMLVAGRVMQGLGGGGMIALSQALLGETVAPRDRARYQAYFATLGVTANGLGPVIGGFLSDYFGWRAVFLISLPLGMLAFYLIRTLPQRRPASAEREPFDYAGLILFSGFVVAALFMLQYIQRFDWALLPHILLLAAISVIAFALLIRVEWRRKLPLIPIELFRDANIWRADAMAAAHGAIVISILTFMPVYLRVMHQYPATRIGLLLVPISLAMATGSIITGRFVSRTGNSAVFPSFGLPLVAVALSVAAAVHAQVTTSMLTVILACGTLFLGTVMGVVQVTVQMAAGQHRLGAAAASVQYSRTFGAAFGTALVATGLLITLNFGHPLAVGAFATALEGGHTAFEGLDQTTATAVRGSIAKAFSVAFLTIAGFAAAAGVIAWKLPLRRV